MLYRSPWNTYLTCFIIRFLFDVEIACMNVLNACQLRRSAFPLAGFDCLVLVLLGCPTAAFGRPRLALLKLFLVFSEIWRQSFRLRAWFEFGCALCLWTLINGLRPVCSRTGLSHTFCKRLADFNQNPLWKALLFVYIRNQDNEMKRNEWPTPAVSTQSTPLSWTVAYASPALRCRRTSPAGVKIIQT